MLARPLSSSVVLVAALVSSTFAAPGAVAPGPAVVAAGDGTYSLNQATCLTPMRVGVAVELTSGYGAIYARKDGVMVGTPIGGCAVQDVLDYFTGCSANGAGDVTCATTIGPIVVASMTLTAGGFLDYDFGATHVTGQLTRV